MNCNPTLPHIHYKKICGGLLLPQQNSTQLKKNHKQTKKQTLNSKLMAQVTYSYICFAAVHENSAINNNINIHKDNPSFHLLNKLFPRNKNYAPAPPFFLKLTIFSSFLCVGIDPFPFYIWRNLKATCPQQIKKISHTEQAYSIRKGARI